MKKLLLVLLLFLCPPVYAGQFSLAEGFSTIHRGTRANVAIIDYRQDNVNLTVGSIYGCSTRDTSWVGAQYMIIDTQLYAGFGVIVNNHITTTLTSHYQFITTFGIYRDRWAFEVRHISNGGLSGNNIGENLVTVSYTF